MSTTNQPRYTIHTDAGSVIGHADTAQRAADLACQYLDDHPGAPHAYHWDATPGYVYPCVQWRRGNQPVAFVGEPYKTWPPLCKPAGIEAP